MLACFISQTYKSKWSNRNAMSVGWARLLITGYGPETALIIAGDYCRFTRQQIFATNKRGLHRKDQPDSCPYGVAVVVSSNERIFGILWHFPRKIYFLSDGYCCRLPKKLDGDRKISLVQFAHSTRMLFVKLLAVVRWVKSSKKFESCAVSATLS